MSKFIGIDERKIKCCDTAEGTIEAGISFEELLSGQKVLRFHFLALNEVGSISQKTKTMYLNEKNIKELIKELKALL